MGLDEAIAVAFVLGVSFVAMICPEEGMKPFRLADQLTCGASTAWMWMAGDFPILTAPADERFYWDSAQDALIDGERLISGLNRVRQLIVLAQRGAGMQAIPVRGQVQPSASKRWRAALKMLKEAQQSFEEIAGRVSRQQENATNNGTR